MIPTGMLWFIGAALAGALLMGRKYPVIGGACLSLVVIACIWWPR